VDALRDRPPICPRCDYDLAGAVAAWRDSCPLTGTCSECGLDLEWARVLREQRVPPWSFEHAMTDRRGRFFQTVQMTFRPSTLWRGMDLSYRIRWPRLVFLLVTGIAILHGLAGAVVVGACAIDPSIQWPLYRRGWTFPVTFDWWDALRTALWPYQPHRRSWGENPVHPAVLHVLLTAALMALAFQALPVTLRRAKVRQRHIWRVWMYSLIPIPVLLSLWGVAIWSVFHFPALLWPATGQKPGWRHPLPLQALEWAQSHDGAILMLAAGAWLWSWWSMACGHYLKLPRSRAVSAVMLLMAGMAGALLVTFVPDLAQTWFQWPTL
jgi:hypothetical protein